VPVGFLVVLLTFNVLLAYGEPAYLPPFETMAHPVPSFVAAFPLAIGLLPVFLGLLVASVAAVVVRARRASGKEREQLRWLLLASASLPLTLLVCWLSYLLIGTADLVVVGLAVMFVAFPAAAGIAIVLIAGSSASGCTSSGSSCAGSCRRDDATTGV
jgi:hypothetical protein